MVRALEVAGLWDELKSDWVLLDSELLPWSYKAEELIKRQYAAVGVAGQLMLSEACLALEKATRRHSELGQVQEKFAGRLSCLTRYTEAYAPYQWEVKSIQDLKIAPFHLLASEGAVHTDKPHDWHMARLSLLPITDGDLFKATQRLSVNPSNPEDVRRAVEWWESLTAAGGEGMVVKPLDFLSFEKNRLIQPALKVRGREYLRLIYGPEYTLPSNMERLRSRSLGTKRSLALRETALGIEALERFVRRETLRRVHECVFAIQALESEAVDPRL
jgi:protein phosphatase